MAEALDEHLSARQWLETFAGRIGTEPPTREQFSALLDLAGVAAHSSQRVAAPIACWLIARAGIEPAAALTIARQLDG